jgi:hypothetical protein
MQGVPAGSLTLRAAVVAKLSRGVAKTKWWKSNRRWWSSSYTEW